MFINLYVSEIYEIFESLKTAHVHIKEINHFLPDTGSTSYTKRRGEADNKIYLNNYPAQSLAR